MLGALVAVLLPGRCAVCERPGDALCAACRSALVRLHEPLCERCGSPGPWPVRRCAECAGRRIAFARARAAVLYDERARRFVHEWKEHGRRRLAEEAAAIVAEVVPRPGTHVALTYVPGDPERAWRRGDVGPRGLARALGEIWKLPVHDVLTRIASQPRQRGLPLAERRRNVRGSVVASQASPPAVCLVDDVYTSGATADACASALRRAGANRVEVVTLARAVR
jgi:predicted amidophosphoribosyltransferase